MMRKSLNRHIVSENTKFFNTVIIVFLNHFLKSNLRKKIVIIERGLEKRYQKYYNYCISKRASTAPA